MPLRGLLNRWIGFCLLLLLAVQFIAQVRLMTYGTETAAVFSRDDTYYYLESAWNLHQYGFTTFDGIHPTNGVQFLWYWLLVLVATPAPSKIALLYMAKLATMIVNLCGYYPLWRLGQRSKAPLLALLLAIPYFFMNISALYVISMENSLHLLLVLVSVYVTYDVITNLRQNTIRLRSLMFLAIVYSLNVWTRLDAALYIVPLYLFVGWHYWKTVPKSDKRRIIYPSIVAAIMGVGLFVGYYAMGNSLLPVSGQIKQSRFYDGVSAHLDLLTLKPLSLSNPLAASIISFDSLTGEYISIYKRLLLVTVFLIGGPYLFLEYHYRKQPQEPSPIRLVSYTSFVFSLCCIPWIMYISGYGGAFINYQAPISGMIILLSGLAFYRFVFVARNLSLHNKLVKYVAVGIPVLTVFIVPLIRPSSNPQSLLTVELPRTFDRYQFAVWMGETLPDDTIIGSWNAGFIAYYSDLQTVNLDGLMNTPEFFEAYLLKDGDLVSYLKENKVRCVADLNLSGRGIENAYQLVELPKDWKQCALACTPEYINALSLKAAEK